MDVSPGNAATVLPPSPPAPERAPAVREALRIVTPSRRERRQTAAADGTFAAESAGEWLGLTCRLIQDISSGAVIEITGEEPGHALALWPAETPVTRDMQAAAVRAVTKGRCVIAGLSASGTVTASLSDVVALPLARVGYPAIVAVVSVPATTEKRRRMIARQLNQCSAWIPLLAHPAEKEEHPGARAVLDAVAHTLEESTLRAAAVAVATHLATQLGCERVSIGLRANRQLRLVAVSRHGSYDERMTLSRSILAAMEEAIDQDAAVAFPVPAGDPARVATAHESLCQDLGQRSACTIPILAMGRLCGAVTFEHESPERFDPAMIGMLEAIVGFIGPILVARHREERGVIERATDEVRDIANRLAGPRHVALKLLTGAGVLLLLIGAFVNGTYRVTAEAVLRGNVQRLVVAPIDSFVAEAPVRAGDVVSEGQVLASLDDRNLQLEQLKWQSERERLLNEYREAMAALDSTKVSILRAQVDRASAELQLVTERLARTRIVAPLAGVVVSGDLTQAIGAPVKQGDTLFEVAPLDRYRVMMQVDERDIAEVAVGQHGRLALSGFPGDRLDLVVERITPVSKVADGRNFFSVEGRLTHRPGVLRPGMQGVVKLDIGPRRLGWIWSHRAVEWLQLHAWYWWPGR